MAPLPEAIPEPTPEPAPEPIGDEQLAQVKVTELERNKQWVVLYSNPLGKACYQLDLKKVESCICELKQGGLLEAGLVFASEVRPRNEDRHLSSKEWKMFQAEIGCPPMLMACAACAAELGRIRQELRVTTDASMYEKEKEVQHRTADILRSLVGHGARISATDVGPHGNTALHVAARSGAPQLLSALLRLDADISARNNDGFSAETVAGRFNHVTCQQILQVASMLDMEKQEAIVKELEEDLQKQQDQKKRGRDRRKRKKQRRRGQQASTAGDSESGGSGQESGSDSALEANSRQDADRAARADGQGTSRNSEEVAEIPQAAYGRNSLWSKLDEDYYPEDWQDDADLPDEWDTAKWGEYQDWGEDWDEDGNSSDADAVSGDDDDDEVRAEVARLRKEKAAQLQQLYDVAADREARLHETEHMEKQGKRLAERAKRLEDREVQIKAGDPGAADATADEVEVSACIERLATMHARSVWELEKTLSKQQAQQAEILGKMEKDHRAMKRRTKGLEHYWDHCFAWQSCSELLNRMAAEHRAHKLVEDIEITVAGLDMPPQLRARLPPLFAPPGEDGQPALPPLRELMAAVQVHHRLQSVRRGYEAQQADVAGFCNEQLKAKDEEILTTVEGELIHRAFPDMEDEKDLESWGRLAELAVRFRQALEQMSSRSQTPPLAHASSSHSGESSQASGSRSRQRG